MDGACLMPRLFQTSGALFVNESMPGQEEGQNGQRREFPLPLVDECSVKHRPLLKGRG